MTFAKLSSFFRALQWQPQRAVSALAWVVTLVLCALVGNDLQRDYAQQLLAADAKTSSLTQLLEEHARQSMRRVELAMSLAAQSVQAQAQAKGGVGPAFGTQLRSYLLQDGLIASFAVVDSSGKTVASTLTDTLSELPQARDRDFYLSFQQPVHGDFFVGQAVKSRISGLWIIPVSIPLQGPWKGYLMAAVDPEYFQRLYQSIDTGDEGFVTLFTTQGWAVARWPFNSEVTEHNWLASPLFKSQLAHADVGVVRQDRSLTGVDSLFSYRAMADYPLVVALGVSRDEVLQPWRERAAYELLGLLLVLLFLAGTSAAVIAQLHRRMRAEAALQLSEISLLKSSLPTLWIGSDARVLRVNRAACELHGYTEEQMLGMTVPDLNPTMALDRWQAHWQRLRQSRNMCFEAVHRSAQGEDMPVEVELNFIEFGGQEYNFAFIRDLRLRKRAETEIERSAALLRSAIDAVDEAFVLFDTEDRLVYCNAKYTELYPALRDVVVPGVRFEDLIRIGARRGLYRESLGREEEWMAERMKAHREGNETRIQKRDDGRVLRVIDRKTPEGNIAGIRVDITEMVNATEEAQNASRYKSQFLANMSHEIRTPMNAILGLLTLLQNTTLSSTQRDYASKTEGAARSLLHLLNDILDFSKVEAGKMALDPQPVRMDRLLRDIAVVLSSSMEGKSVELLFDIDVGVPTEVVADAMRLQQVLINLGGNAIKFTAQGQVVLRVRLVPAPARPDLADPAAPADNRWIEFSVEDSGIGIAPDQLEHIFTGFSQAEASTTRRFGGTGLGLAISRRLVELMGGQLAVHSTPGQGSTFRFALQLPLAANASLGALPAPDALPTLVVDDNPVALGILAAMVRAWSWPTQQAPGGAAALALLQRQDAPVGLVLLDCQMPEMDGWETARQIRKLYQGQNSQPRIVMVSSNPHDSLLLRSAEEQALVDGLLCKPVIAATLRQVALGIEGSDVQALAGVRVGQRPLLGLRILVVDDNRINQQVAQELLQAEGARVSLAANGQLGVEAVAAARPAFDAVLMDIQMPVLDGYGATHKIRGELDMADLPIIAMTANAMPSDREACLAAGMNDHVGKPFDMRHLVSLLLAHIAVPETSPMPSNPSLPAPPSPSLSGASLPEPSPYLDVAGALHRISGLTSLYLDIAQDFVVALDAVEGAFRQAAQAGQMRALAGQMHTLKGTAATLGADLLSGHAAGLDRMLRQSPENFSALEHLPGLLELVAHTRKATLDAVDRLQALG